MIFIFSSCTEKNLVTGFQSEFMVSAHINIDKVNSVLTKIIHIERNFAVLKSGLHSKKLHNLFYFQPQVDFFLLFAI